MHGGSRGKKLAQIKTPCEGVVGIQGPGHTAGKDGQLQPTKKLRRVQIRDLPIFSKLLRYLCSVTVDSFEQGLHAGCEVAQHLAAPFASLFMLIAFLGVFR